VGIGGFVSVHLASVISEYACRGPGRGSLQFSLLEFCQKKSPRYLISDSEPPAVISLYSGRRLVSSNADCQSAVAVSPIIVAVAEAVQLVHRGCAARGDGDEESRCLLFLEHYVDVSHSEFSHQ